MKDYQEEITEYIPTPEDEQQMYEFSIAVSTIKNIAERKDLVKQSIKDQILGGYLNPLEFYRQRKVAADVLEELGKDKDILDCAETEIKKYGKEKPAINGAIVTMGSRDTPNYSTCGDAVYDKLKEQLKEREKFLKGLPAGGMLVTDEESGETVKLFPPTYSSTSFVTVKI